MILFKLSIYFLSILAPGYLVLLIFNKEKLKFLQLTALAYGLGSFFITIQLFLYLFIFRLHFSWWFFAGYIIEIILLTLLVFKRVNLAVLLSFNYKFWRHIKVKEAIVIFLIIIQILFIFSNALARPTVVYDSVAMWTMKAKTLFTENQVNFNPDSPTYLSSSHHRNYPWHVPLMSYWLFNVLGEFNDLLVNLIFVSYFICLLIVCYCFIKEYISKFYSLIFVFFLSSMPLVFYHGFNAYADLTLSFYVLISFVYLFKWLEAQESRYLVYSGIFSGIACFVKNEAIIFIIASLLIIALNIVISRNWQRAKHLFHYVFFVILSILPWLVFKATHNLDISNVKEGFGFYPDVLKSLFGALFTSNSWNIWWFIVIISIIVNFKNIIKNKELILGWLFLFFSLAGFLILYLFTEEYQYALNNTAISRNILTLIPISVFITAISFKRINNSK